MIYKLYKNDDLIVYEILYHFYLKKDSEISALFFEFQFQSVQYCIERTWKRHVWLKVMQESRITYAVNCIYRNSQLHPSSS